MVTKNPRRLILGDVHGCADELRRILKEFDFQKGQDRLFSVGDILGKGPAALECLTILKEFQAIIVRGNHDQHAVNGSRLTSTDRKASHQAYLDSLGTHSESWIREIEQWPLWHEEVDFCIVHAGLHPDRPKLEEMDPRILQNIRTWDGIGIDLKNSDNPPWFTCTQWNKPVIFGHWAQRGLVDLPNFKGLDTGCVYGRFLTGFCPEENRFVQIPARHTYSPIT